MSDGYVHLIGTEEVTRAGHRMEGAAATMMSAAESMSHTVSQLLHGIDERLDRLEALVERLEKMEKAPTRSLFEQVFGGHFK